MYIAVISRFVSTCDIMICTGFFLRAFCSPNDISDCHQSGQTNSDERPSYSLIETSALSVRICRYIWIYPSLIFCKQSRYCFINSAAATILHHCHWCLGFCSIIPSTETDLILKRERGRFLQWINL